MGETNLGRVLRNNQTWSEQLLWRWLRSRRFSSYKFRRQHPLAGFYLEFFCEEARLAIELDGFHHGFPEQQARDLEREQVIASHGVKILRFWNSHLRRNPQAVRDAIFFELQGRAPHPLPDYTKVRSMSLNCSPSSRPSPPGEGGS